MIFGTASSAEHRRSHSGCARQDWLPAAGCPDLATILVGIVAAIIGNLWQRCWVGRTLGRLDPARPPVAFAVSGSALAGVYAKKAIDRVIPTPPEHPEAIAAGMSSETPASSAARLALCG